MNSCQNISLGLACALGLGAIGCAQETPPAVAPAPAGQWVAPNVLRLGHIEHPRIKESSGVVASRRFPGVFWTHNDNGGPGRQVLYAISREGKTLGEHHVTGAVIDDWEDLGIDDHGHLYLGDIGNNDAKRNELTVLEVDEPDPRAPTKHHVRPNRSWRLRFPQAPFDCESLFIWKDHGYVVSKVFKDARAQIFRFPLTEAPTPVTLELVATTRIDAPVTGATISPNGQLLGLVAKSSAFVYRVDGDVSKAGKGKPHQTKLPKDHIESCCFVPEGLIATSEGRDIYLFTAEAFRWQ